MPGTEVVEHLSARLLAGGVPPSLLIDLYDVAGMRHALAAELAAVQTDRTLRETTRANAVPAQAAPAPRAQDAASA